ncbi:MAG: 1-acyl-sn-glycerol-3-phosphate acyltransferase [Candidatus Cryptobacteroides sp.]|nr:1-acyl-sn-glycerol-3-phosphate acyltransferase [Rikenellaceae bacterium]MDY5746837.1 1-acyl-sn-glycerol-3-phosphate acyltransferase [Candidatus Cryptobacteroides sp.]
MNEQDYTSISPYTDQEAVEALKRVARNPFLPVVSKFFFPGAPLNTFRKLLKEIHSIDDFQEIVMSRMVSTAIERSTSGFSYEGVENISGNGKFLAVSNHRDIILDPALFQYVLFSNRLQMTEICVGSNLLESNKVVSDLLRSNRMIKVIRGISARELYLSSKLLSSYIRERITSGGSSVWIAQREGRTKDGFDKTEQGLLKMFDMSGEGSFQENFEALNIIPVSISYEYESCDIRKARELLISEKEKYVKKKHEDTHSIISGVKQWKGGVNLFIDKPLTGEEIAQAAQLGKNDRYQALRQILDNRIIRGYKLWKTNYMAYDLLHGENKYADRYSAEDLEKFKAYTEHKLSKVERSLDRDALRIKFLQIYGNPVVNKESIIGGKVQVD